MVKPEWKSLASRPTWPSACPQARGQSSDSHSHPAQKQFLPQWKGRFKDRAVRKKTVTVVNPLICFPKGQRSKVTLESSWLE